MKTIQNKNQIKLPFDEEDKILNEIQIKKKPLRQPPVPSSNDTMKQIQRNQYNQDKYSQGKQNFEKYKIDIARSKNIKNQEKQQQKIDQIIHHITNTKNNNIKSNNNNDINRKPESTEDLKKSQQYPSQIQPQKIISKQTQEQQQQRKQEQPQLKQQQLFIQKIDQNPSSKQMQQIIQNIIQIPEKKKELNPQNPVIVIDDFDIQEQQQKIDKYTQLKNQKLEFKEIDKITFQAEEQENLIKSIQLQIKCVKNYAFTDIPKEVEVIQARYSKNLQTVFHSPRIRIEVVGLLNTFCINENDPRTFSTFYQNMQKIK